MRTRLSLPALVAAFAAAAGAASAQDGVQITNEAISRTCQEIHRNPQAQAQGPEIGPGGNLVINCRLIRTDGVTIAQVSPEEVCERMNGSRQWERGAGTQVFCRGAQQADKEFKPKSSLVSAEDIARACQRTHRNPQATAEPTTIGPTGELQLNCRLVNQNGFVLARVSPEDVCEMLYGVRGYVRAGTSFLCRATPVETAEPERSPNKPPVFGGGKGDIPLTPERLNAACGAFRGVAGATGQIKWEPWFEPTIVCTFAGGGVVNLNPPQLCPHVTGTTGWYVGEQSPPPGPMALSVPNVTCRGNNPREFIALAHQFRYCKLRGYAFGNTGLSSGRGAVCANKGAVMPVQVADICREQYGTTAFVARGLLHWCPP